MRVSQQGLERKGLFIFYRLVVRFIPKVTIDDATGEIALLVGVSVALTFCVEETVGFQLHVAVIGDDPTVGTARQPAIRFPFAMKRTFPGWLRVATT